MQETSQSAGRFGRERFAMPGSDLEQRYVRASLARSPRERVAASALDAVMTFVPASLAILYDVDEHGAMAPRMALRARSFTGADTDEVARQLGELEPIDPFSVRRAQAGGRTMMSTADLGGEEALRRSMYGRHLRRMGLGAPLQAYFWSEGRIAAGLALFRAASGPAFTAAEARLLARLDPLVEHALCRTYAAGELPDLPAELLTARERDVAQLVLAGVSNARVGEGLGMSEATVKTHLTRIYAKLGIRNRTELATQFRRAKQR